MAEGQEPGSNLLHAVVGVLRRMSAPFDRAAGPTAPLGSAEPTISGNAMPEGNAAKAKNAIDQKLTRRQPLRHRRYRWPRKT